MTDFDLQSRFLMDLFETIDKQAAPLLSAVSEVKEEPGLEAQALVFMLGVGFTAAQQYMMGVRGWLNVDTGTAFKLGPAHNGVKIADAVNAVANYWKHADDSGAQIYESTKSTLRSIGLEVPSQFMSWNALGALGIDRFSELFPKLIDWRDSLIAYQKTNPRNGFE